MRRKDPADYVPGSLGPLTNVLADLYVSFGKESENLYLVGGLVPEFLVTNKISYLREYLGTLDIDLAVRVALKKPAAFKDFYRKLRSLGFEKQKTADGLDFMSHSFVKHEAGNREIILDLIVDDRFEPKADKLKEIAPDVEAVKFRGVYLVFEDHLQRKIKGASGKSAIIRIPNIVPFLALKAFAYMDEDNGTAKDAFDIWYTVVNYEDGPESVNKEALKHGGNPDVRDAFKGIKRFFRDESSQGTKDAVNILVNRYGLDMARANREVVSPLKLVEGF